VTWTDDKIGVLAEKIDTLEVKVDAGFARAEVEYARTDQRFKAVGEHFDDVDQRVGDLAVGIKQMDAKFDGLQRTLMQIAAGLIGTLIAGILVPIGTVVTLILTQ